MFSSEFIQWRGKQAAWRNTICFEKIPSSILAVLVPFPEPILSPKIFTGEGELKTECEPLCSSLSADRTTRYKGGTRISRYASSITSELQSFGWDKNGRCDESHGLVLLWEPRGAGCHESFLAKLNERAPAVSSSPDHAKHGYGPLGPRLTNPVSTPAKSTKLRQCLLAIAL